MLPIVFFQGKWYYVDERLKQMRNIDNPNDFEYLEEGQIQFWRTNGTPVYELSDVEAPTFLQARQQGNLLGWNKYRGLSVTAFFKGGKIVLIETAPKGYLLSCGTTETGTRYEKKTSDVEEARGIVFIYLARMEALP